MFNIDLYNFLFRLSPGVANRYEKYYHRRLISYLKRIDPEALERLGKTRALRAFQSAARRVPYYRKFLASHGIDPKSIRAFEDFRKLPMLDKNIFYEAEITDLALDGHIRRAKNILTSSGFSGKFSFGINLTKNLENTARTIDLVLDYILHIGKKRTLAINCLPMGVRMHTRMMTLAEVSVRDDMALALVDRFHRFFDQIIIIGEAFFLKHLVEEGIKKGIEWPKLNVSLVCGEDSFPESYRTYMGALLGISHDAWPMERLIGSSLGIAEIDLNLFHETPDTIRIRRFAYERPDFRSALFGEEMPITPMLFQYYPHRTLLEENQTGDLTTTTTFSPCDIPLIRYNTKDRGKIIPWLKTKTLLDSFGKMEWVPQLRLPLVAVWSRHAGTRDFTALADELRDAIFRNQDIAGRLTGYFKIRTDEDKLQRIDLQLKKEYSGPHDGKFVVDRLLVPGVAIHPVAYYDFHEALILNYEVKFHHS